MAIRNIATKGDEVLHKKTRTVEKFDERLWELLDDMKETMDASNGVGLAAPQVSILRKIAIVCTDDEKVYELINPKIIETDGEQEDVEGCLSVPGVYGIVKRPMRVKVSAQDRHGNVYEAEGTELLARAFCHEIEHLEGKLFTDHVTEYVDLDKSQEEE